MHFKEHNSVKVQKNSVYEKKRVDVIRNRRRSGLKNPDNPNNFIKNNVRNDWHHQFYPVLAKIRINRGLLHDIS